MPNSTPKQERRPRYRQDPNHPRSRRFKFGRSPHDLEILLAVFDYGRVREDHLARLLDIHPKSVSRRLSGLFHNNYLVKRTVHLSPTHFGSSPDVYALGQSGAAYLREYFAQKIEGYYPYFRTIQWQRSFEELEAREEAEDSQQNLRHDLFVTEIMTQVIEAVRVQEGVRFIPFREMLLKAPEATRKDSTPYAWKVEHSRERDPDKKHSAFTIKPDHIYGLEFGGEEVSYFFLEADRGTMNERAKHFYGSSIYKKVVNYWESYDQGVHLDRFGIGNARVQFLTTKGAVRVANMITDTRDEHINSGAGSTMFMFASQRDLEQAESILSLEWHTGTWHDQENAGVALPASAFASLV